MRGRCTGGGRWQKKNKSGVGSSRNEPQLALVHHFLQNYTCFHWMHNPVISLDEISTTIHFGLAALAFSASCFTSRVNSRAPRSSCCYHISLPRAADQTMPVTAFWTQENLSTLTKTSGAPRWQGNFFFPRVEGTILQIFPGLLLA